MDSYLEIAKKILGEARQPLSAQEILKAAYQLQIVPRDLYGRTQHKTLQARLSTDILRRRVRSEFCRTGPGKFFLRALLYDRRIPAQFRREYLAPLRAAQLGRFEAVGLSRQKVKELFLSNPGPRLIADLFRVDWQYYKLRELQSNYEILPLRFVIVVLDDHRAVLNHRRPLENGDLMRGFSLGFAGVVKRSDKSLFSTDDVGLPDAAMRTLIEHFEISGSLVDAISEPWRWSPWLALYAEGTEPVSDDLMSIVSFTCSGIREMISTIDANESLGWAEIPVRANDLERFDRWSALLVTSNLLREVGGG